MADWAEILANSQAEQQRQYSPQNLFSLMQQVKMGRLQEQQAKQNLQTGDLENQKRQMDIQSAQRQRQDAQTIQHAMAQNPGNTYSDLLPKLQGKISPSAWQQLVESDQKIRKGYSEQTETDLKNSAAQHGQYQQIYDSIMQMPDQQVQQNWPQVVQAIKAVPGNKINLDPAQPLTKQQLQQFGPMLSMNDAYLKQELAKRKDEAETYKATQQGNEAAATIPKIQTETQAAKAGLPFIAPQKSAELAKTQAETQKVTTETQNLGQQPIFAVDPQTNQRVMTTRPEAQEKGYTNLVPVKEGDVQKQTDAVAMTNDVQLNVSRYRSAMNRMYQEPMNGKQMAALTALTPEKLGIEIGHGFGFNLPDVIQKVANASAFSVLSPSQKQAVLGYYSTLASVPAAQKALTNIGRSNKEMMDLELRTIPTPLMDHETFNLGMDRFQGNVNQTAAKNVRIPGMPTSQSIREEIEGPPPDNRPPFNFQMPQPMQSAPLSSLMGR